MMINTVHLMGRVGRIETKSMNNGTNVTNLSIATSKKFVKNGEKIEKTTWHNVALYSKLSEIADKYVAIGDLFYIEGEIENQKYTDAQGVEKTRSFIIGHDIKLMPKGNKDYKPKQTDDLDQFIADSALDDDVPF